MSPPETATAPGQAAAAKPATGVLEIVRENEIAGWAHDPACAAGETLVTIAFDGLPVVEVAAHLPRADVARRHGTPLSGFRFVPSARLVAALPAGTKVTATVGQDARPLHVVGDPFTLGRRSPEMLFDLLKSGHRVSAKSGDIYLPIAQIGEWDRVVGAAYRSAEMLLRGQLKRDIFLAYGSLLGIVRQGRFLSHDDDFDIGFFSPATTVEAFAADFVAFGRQIEALGAKVTMYESGNMHVVLPGTKMILDLFGFALIDGHLQGYQLYHPVPASPLIDLVEARCGSNVFRIPKDAEIFLSGVYGDDWHVPKPHFQWHPSDDNKAAMRRLEIAIRAERVKS